MLGGAGASARGTVIGTGLTAPPWHPAARGGLPPERYPAEPEAVLLSVDDLEGLEMTLEILGEAEAVGRISEGLAALEHGEPGADMATVRQDLACRRATGR